MSHQTTLETPRPAPVILDGQQLLTISQAAEFLQVADLTVRRLISRGDLKAVRLGRNIRIKGSDLLKALKPVTNAPLLRGDVSA